MSAEETGDTFEQVLGAAAEGDEARERAWSRLYEEILVVAGAQRSRWSGDWTIETRVLANEVYIKLFDNRTPAPKSRKHFFALLSKAMRHILVNYAEARRTAKRGGGVADVTLHEEPGIALDVEASDTLLELHDALRRFEALDGRAATVVELRFFAGLSYDEIAEAVGVAKATVRRDWDAARAWLNRELTARTTMVLRLDGARDETEDDA